MISSFLPSGKAPSGKEDPIVVAEVKAASFIPERKFLLQEANKKKSTQSAQRKKVKIPDYVRNALQTAKPNMLITSVSNVQQGDLNLERSQAKKRTALDDYSVLEQPVTPENVNKMQGLLAGLIIDLAGEAALSPELEHFDVNGNFTKDVKVALREYFLHRELDSRGLKSRVYC
jgi:hypothetical protein